MNEMGVHREMRDAGVPRLSARLAERGRGCPMKEPQRRVRKMPEVD